jgi:hypothetical protein
MKRRVFFTLFALSVLLPGSAVTARPFFQNFDKAAFYSALASGRLETVNAELTLVTASTLAEKEAYEGALLMRKAGLLSRPREKLSTFRSGAVKLENSLAKDSGNVEYHFLRLIIQEHAPKIVHYDKSREQDSRLIIRAFPTVSPVLKNAILQYSTHSKLIHERELNG